MTTSNDGGQLLDRLTTAIAVDASPQKNLTQNVEVKSSILATRSAGIFFGLDFVKTFRLDVDIQITDTRKSDPS
jgi:hypothetical protein